VRYHNKRVFFNKVGQTGRYLKSHATRRQKHEIIAYIWNSGHLSNFKVIIQYTWDPQVEELKIMVQNISQKRTLCHAEKGLCFKWFIHFSHSLFVFMCQDEDENETENESFRSF